MLSLDAMYGLSLACGQPTRVARACRCSKPNYRCPMDFLGESQRGDPETLKRLRDFNTPAFCFGTFAGNPVAEGNARQISYLSRRRCVYSSKEYTGTVIKQVDISDGAKKQLKKVPVYVAEKLAAWVQAVEKQGLDEVRKLPGYHDEPLKGKRAGQRSIRLSKAYRAIYKIVNGGVEVEVLEVSKHDY